MIFILRVLFTIQAMAFFALPVAAAPGSRIVSASEHELTLILDAPAPSVERQRSADADWPRQRIMAPGWPRTTVPGLPDLPVQSVLPQVPASGRITMDVQPENMQSLSMPEPAVVPRLTLDEDGMAQMHPGEKIQADKPVGLFPETWAELGPREWIRNTPVVRLTLHPFRWNRQSQTLLQAGRLQVVLHFEEALSHSSAGEIPADASGIQQILIKDDPAAGSVRKTDPPAVQAIAPNLARISVTTDGMMSITVRDLLSAGFTARNLQQISPNSLRLTCQGQEIPLQTNCKVGRGMVPGNVIRFYGRSLNTQYTGSQVYWLSWEETAGLRMGDREGAVTGAGVSVTQYRERQHAEDNTITWAMTPGAPNVDYWFWEKWTAPVSRQYAVPLTRPSGDTQGILRVAFQGRSTDAVSPDHRVHVRINGESVGEISWDGDTAHIAALTLPAGILVDGDNAVQIDLPGSTGASVDVVYLNWIEIDYTRSLQAISDQLDFSVSGTGLQQITVTGFSDPRIRVYDITDPDAPVEILHPVILPSDSGYQVQFETDVQGTGRYLALTESGVQRSTEIRKWQSVGLKDAGTGADWIGITDQAFLSALEPLRQLREAQGLRAKTVSVQQIMDEFNDGIFDPAAIRTFLKYTFEHWPAPAPLFVLMAGDANYDYRDYMKTGKANQAPVYLSWTDEIGLTPDDNYYVCVSGEDRLPDMIIGRIPGSNADAITAQVRKILAHETAAAGGSVGAGNVLLVADNNDPEFESIDEAMTAYIPSSIPTERVYLSRYGSTEAATRDLIDQIDRGAGIVNYVGHGAVTNWGGEFLFKNSDVALLSNSLWPFGIHMTCLNGFFAHYAYYCLAEEMIRFGDRGSIGGFASSGLGYSWEHELMEHVIFNTLFNLGEYRIGVLCAVAKLSAYAQGATQNTVTTFTLLGDPASHVR